MNLNEICHVMKYKEHITKLTIDQINIRILVKNLMNSVMLTGDQTYNAPLTKFARGLKK